MNEEEIKKLNEKVNNLLEQIHKDGKVHLEQTREMINKELKEVINNYSSETRNLAIISGTIAPFSLTLLSLEKLDVNAVTLLCGFSILLLNIILAQFLIRTLLKRYDYKVSRAEINWIFASFELDELGDKTKDLSEKTLKLPEYLKNVDEMEKALRLNPMNTELQLTRNSLRNYSRFVNIFFMAGAMFIVLSVIINPIVNWIASIHWSTISFVIN